MKIEDILEQEKDNMLDYLLCYCDTPLKLCSEDLQELFNSNGIENSRDIRSILDDSFNKAYFNGFIPPEIQYSVWIDIGEIEIPAAFIEPEEIEEFTIHGEYAYYYVGYGFTVEFDKNSILHGIDDLLEVHLEN